MIMNKNQVLFKHKHIELQKFYYKIIIHIQLMYFLLVVFIMNYLLDKNYFNVEAHYAKYY